MGVAMVAIAVAVSAVFRTKVFTASLSMIVVDVVVNVAYHATALQACGVEGSQKWPTGPYAGDRENF